MLTVLFTVRFSGQSMVNATCVPHSQVCSPLARTSETALIPPVFGSNVNVFFPMGLSFRLGGWCGTFHSTRLDGPAIFCRVHGRSVRGMARRIYHHGRASQ